MYAPSKLTLKGQQNGVPVEFELEFHLSEEELCSESAPVHRLATKAQIKLLEDEEAAIALNGLQETGKANIFLLFVLREI